MGYQNYMVANHVCGLMICAGRHEVAAMSLIKPLLSTPHTDVICPLELQGAEELDEDRTVGAASRPGEQSASSSLIRPSRHDESYSDRL